MLCNYDAIHKGGRDMVVVRSHDNLSSGNLQVAWSCKLLPTCFTGKCSYQCSEAAPKITTFPVKQSIPGPGFIRRQLPLPAVLTHLCQFLPCDKYPFCAFLTKKPPTKCIGDLFWLFFATGRVQQWGFPWSLVGWFVDT